ncbi:MAG: redoxin domain-containing protein [Candidatus Eisenbacteria bacterium]
MLDAFLIDHRVAFATWAEPLVWALVPLAMLAMWWLGRGRPYGIPQGAMARMGVVAALAIGTLGLWIGATLRGPFWPIMETTRRLQHTIGRPAPEVVFQRLPDGAPVRLSAFRGRVVLLNLWATWCPPCVVELPALRELERRLGPEGLAVVAVSDEPFADVAAFGQRVSLPSVTGAAPDFAWLPMQGSRPYTLVIDRQGVLRVSVFGRLDADGFERLVRPYL